jgi:regulator of replication initiation timing
MHTQAIVSLGEDCATLEENLLLLKQALHNITSDLRCAKNERDALKLENISLFDRLNAVTQEVHGDQGLRSVSDFFLCALVHVYSDDFSILLIHVCTHSVSRRQLDDVGIKLSEATEVVLNGLH